MRSTRCHGNRPEDEILTKSSRMNGLKRQAPFKSQLLQISLLTVLNDGSVRRLAIIKTIFLGPLSHKGMKIQFKNILECGAVGKEKELRG